MVKITKQRVFLSLFSENKALKIQLARIKSETSFEFFSWYLLANLHVTLLLTLPKL